jgi:hypothetical protein
MHKHINCSNKSLKNIFSFVLSSHCQSLALSLSPFFLHFIIIRFRLRRRLTRDITESTSVRFFISLIYCRFYYRDDVAFVHRFHFVITLYVYMLYVLLTCNFVAAAVAVDIYSGPFVYHA